MNSNKRKRRSSKGGHGGSAERWLVSYADLITLLFAFFVILYSISQQDVEKFKKVAESLRGAFAGPPIQFEDKNMGKTQAPELKVLRDSLDAEAGSALELEDDAQGLKIKFSLRDFFAAGKAQISPDLYPLLDRVGRILAKSPAKQIRIEGHADLAELEKSEYPSGWELSSARASTIARLWIERVAIQPERLLVSGYAHYQPKHGAQGVQAHPENRRVEILIPNQ